MVHVSSRFEDSRGFKFGVGLGALVLTAAGAAWSIVALIFREGTAVWQYVLAMLPVVTLTALIVRRLAAIAKVDDPQPSEGERIESARQARRMGLLFAVVVTIEVALIVLAAFALARVNRPSLIPVAVMVIVGAHFVPLARVFRIPAYSVTGFVLVGVAGGSLLIPNESVRLFALGVGSAVVFWASAAAVVAIHVKTES